MNHQQTGLLIIGLGLVILLLGLLVWSGGFGWFGRLPGDIRIERENFRLYIPLTSMLLLSVALSVFLSLIRRLL
ncbi:MAG: DUF2905 domain-containing protein [Chloroflexi bacterium]|nr:MAG: DUF2905 domain-containing protein [Chloroflexota bacterium]